MDSFRVYLSESILPHTEEDDAHFNRILNKYFDKPNEPIGTIGNIKVSQRVWPYGTINYLLIDGQPIGFAIVQQGGRTRDESADWYSITMMYLQKAYRQKGLGTEFYKFLDQKYKLKPDTKQSAGGAGLLNSLRKKGIIKNENT